MDTSLLDDDDIDDLAATLRLCLPDDTCKAQLGLLIYKEVMCLRRVVDQLAELVVNQTSSHLTDEEQMDEAKSQLVKSIRLKIAEMRRG